ncbi:hypothetical protein T4B_3515 [Trichinella pseudospiralis]|uniref:Uncharacterized protein n=2 Tax=Trichinella pseudospiralis TaxID=6337 RepID=A0A0V1FTC6_TRIPS|nr:hypothetical protein T4A_7695 [Trichinella pseudospiralis]KRY89250.1 hypothetical protein T4D_8476 [Trichinella pseudospiralis]KRZ26359.1 hypothetical protein T4B_3515 [Trichinella pseudospiralis]
MAAELDCTKQNDWTNLRRVSPPLYTYSSANVVDQWRLSTGLFDKCGNGLMPVNWKHKACTFVLYYKRKQKIKSQRS